jgi:hypothetical protein
MQVYFIMLKNNSQNKKNVLRIIIFYLFIQEKRSSPVNMKKIERSLLLFSSNYSCIQEYFATGFDHLLEE